MHARRIILAIAALAAVAVATPAGADPVDDLLTQAGETAYATVNGVDVTVAVDPTQSLVTQEIVTLDYYTDGIFITNQGYGTTVSYRGVLGNRAWWDCSHATTAGGSILVTCNALPSTGKVWHCGAMHVGATVYSTAVGTYDHVRDTVRTVGQSTGRDLVGVHSSAPNVPDPRPRQWGQAAGRVTCDGQALGTAQANSANPHQTALATMGPVTTLTCEARLSPSSASAPVPAYSVTCIDPPNRAPVR